MPGLSADTGALRTAALTVVLSLALVIAAAAVAIPASSLWGRQAADADRERLTGVAVEVALLLSSLSVDDAEATLNRLTELSTGRFREEVTERRAEVLRLVDDDEVRSSARVIASGIEQDVAVRGVLSDKDEPARARVLVATRAEVRNSRTDAAGRRAGPPGSGSGRDTEGRAGTGTQSADGPAGERTWRWRLEAVIEGGRAAVTSVEVAV